MLSSRLVEFVKSVEGFRAKAYVCPGGKWTVGYGHTQGVYPGMKVTKDQAERFLVETLAEVSKIVARLVKVPLTLNQHEALVSLAMNIGTGRFSKSSLLKKLNTRDFAGASKEFRRWVRSGGKILPGLVTRRSMEQRIFEGGWS